MAIELFSKHSLVSGNTPANLEQGELAVNIPDRRLFVGGENGNSIVKLYYGTTNYFDDNGYANRAKTLNGYTHNDFIKPSDLEPTIAIDNNQINFSVAGVGSEFITVPYATTAGQVAWANVFNKPSFATVATSGSYNDLSNKPDLTVYALNTNLSELSTNFTNYKTGIADGTIVVNKASYATSAGSASSAGYATSAGEIINSSTWIVAPLSSGTGAQVQGSLTVRPAGSSSGVNFNVDSNGNVTAYGDITAYSTSDKRLKDNITPIAAKDALKVIKSLNPVTFDWNDTATSLSERLKGHSQGFIAQEYEKIIPNSSHLMWGEYKGIDYLQSIPYIVAVEQNHESRIERLEKKVKELETRLAKYESID